MDHYLSRLITIGLYLLALDLQRVPIRLMNSHMFTACWNIIRIALDGNVWMILMLISSNINKFSDVLCVHPSFILSTS